MISDKTVKDLENLKTSAFMRDNKSAREIVNDAIDTIRELDYLCGKAAHDLVENAIKNKDSVLEQIRWERDQAFEQLEANGLRLGHKDDYGWVDCSKRLPDKPVVGEKGYIVQKANVREPFSAYWNGTCFTNKDNDVITEIIAWRNLPETYGGWNYVHEEVQNE